MRNKHELSRGVVCERCLCTVLKVEYRRVTTVSPIVDDNTGKCKTINRLNLCGKCYAEYKKLVKNFVAGKGVTICRK